MSSMKVFKIIIATLLVLLNTSLMVTAEGTKNVSYKGTVDFSTGEVNVVEIEVDADDEQEAMEIARQEADPSVCDDWSYSIDCVECIDDED